MLTISFSAWAGEYQDGVAAFEKEDYTTAVAKFKTAAEKGNVNAQAILGIMYESGFGVEKNDAEAVRWSMLAAKKGDDLAQSTLGIMYTSGRGVAQDYGQAVYWYKLSAEQGNASSQTKLGAMYAIGTGVKLDYIKAHMWSNLAAAKGEKNALEVREIVAKQMTPQQIAQAQKLATECQARNYKRCD